MNITKEMILKRQAVLQAEQEKVLGTLQAYNGAIQNNKYWLDMLEKEEQPEIVRDHQEDDENGE